MKKPCFFLSLLLAGSALPITAQEQAKVPPAFEKSAEETDAPGTDPFDPDTTAPKLIRVLVEFIEVPHETLTRLLLLSTPENSNGTALRKQVQELVAKNEAKVMETQMVVGRSGEKSTSKSVHEFIYPTEFEPSSDESKINPSQSSFPMNPATPTAFETRNLGSILEIEPTLAQDGKTIDLRMVPEIVWHTGDTVWQETRDSAGNLSKVRMPDIYSLMTTTSITCISGQSMFAAVHSPADAKGDPDLTRKIMVFVKCDAMIVK